MKKFTVCLLIGAMAASMLTGCGSNGGSSPQYIVLNIDGNEFIRWLRDQNGQYRNRTGFGIFEG